MARLDLLHERFEFFEIVFCLIVVAQAHGILAHFGLWAADDYPAQMILGMRLVVVEDRNVYLLAPPIGAHREIRLHVFHGNAILMEEGAGDALAHLFLRRISKIFLASDEIEDIAISHHGFVCRVCCIVRKKLRLRLRSRS